MIAEFWWERELFRVTKARAYFHATAIQGLRYALHGCSRPLTLDAIYSQNTVTPVARSGTVIRLATTRNAQ